jgi:hypothetical protein
MDLNAREGAEIKIDLDVENVKAVTGGIIELSGKALNQDVTLMTWNFEIKGITHSQTTISVSAGEMLKYMLRHLLMQKLEQEALFTFMGVQKTNQ